MLGRAIQPKVPHTGSRGPPLESTFAKKLLVSPVAMTVKPFGNSSRGCVAVLGDGRSGESAFRT